MMRTVGWWIVVSVVFFQSVAWAQTSEGEAPSQEEVARAGEHFKRGVDLFRDEDYQAALVEFERANRVLPSYHVQFNIGQVAYELKDYARALKSYRRFLDEGGDAIPANKRAQAETAIEKLEVRVGELSVVTNIERGELLIDDTKVADLPSSGAILVSAGRRKVSVLEPGKAALTRFVDIAGGDEVSVEIMSGDATGKATAAEAPPQRTEPSAAAAVQEKRGLPTGLWVSAGLTVGLAAGATTLGILTVSAKSDYDSQLEGVVDDPGALDGDWKTVERRALITDVLIGASVVAATATVVIAVASKKRKEPLAQLQVTPTSVAVAGSF